MTPVAIARKRAVSPADFARDHLAGDGVPLVVTDAIDRWPARSKWTFEYFKTAYAADIVMAPLGLGGTAARITRLGAFIDGLGQPADHLPGFWVDTRDGRPMDTAPPGPASPPYLLAWGAFKRHPELFDDIAPSLYFTDDWMATFEPALREVFEWTSGREYWAIYLGPTGSLSPLHQDFWSTHTTLSQLSGRKRAILFPPGDAACLYDGKVDPEHPDFEQFPMFAGATPHECTLEPGDTLFMPPDWWHFVRAIDHSITLSHSFFNGANGGEHFTRMLQKLPALVAGLGDHPATREGLNISWISRGFDSPLE